LIRLLNPIITGIIQTHQQFSTVFPGKQQAKSLRYIVEAIDDMLGKTQPSLIQPGWRYLIFGGIGQKKAP